jgi:hypothetical protein
MSPVLISQFLLILSAATRSFLIAPSTAFIIGCYR